VSEARKISELEEGLPMNSIASSDTILSDAVMGEAELQCGGMLGLLSEIRDCHIYKKISQD
jgi:hypothetical protein